MNVTVDNIQLYIGSFDNSVPFLWKFPCRCASCPLFLFLFWWAPTYLNCILYIIHCLRGLSINVYISPKWVHSQEQKIVIESTLTVSVFGQCSLFSWIWSNKHHKIWWNFVVLLIILSCTMLTGLYDGTIILEVVGRHFMTPLRCLSNRTAALEIGHSKKT